MRPQQQQKQYLQQQLIKIIIYIGTTTYIITLPLVANTHQIVHIRNGSSVALTLKTNETGTKIYPNGTATVFTTTYGSFGANTTQNLYSNGTNWIGF